LPVKQPRTSWSLLAPSSDQRKEKEMTMLRFTITAGLIALAAAGGTMAIAPAAQADTGVDDNGVRAAGVRAAADETPRAGGSITFRSERYQLSDRAVVSTSPTTIRILDDSAITKDGTRTSLYIQLGYTLDPSKPSALRVNSGVAIRGYNFADGTYDKGQAIELGQSTLSLDPPNRSDATHVWGHLNSPTERGIDLDVHGVHFGNPS
jgi:hypothetical protein